MLRPTIDNDKILVTQQANMKASKESITWLILLVLCLLSPITVTKGEPSLANSSSGVKRAETYVVPGDPSWLGDYGNGDGTPDYQRFLPIVYTVLGDGGTAIPRVIIKPSDSCPKVVRSNTNVALPKVKLRAVGDYTMPYAFPIKVRERGVLRTHDTYRVLSHSVLLYM